MKHRMLYTTAAIVLCVALLLTACKPAATPTPQPTAVPTKAPTAVPTVVPTAVPTAVPTVAPPCLIIGALYGGPINDAGYNQAMHEAVIAIKTNIACVKVIEAENVPDEAGATSTMENMIQQGAKMIFATAFNHQYPALDLSKKYADVIFEHAGGWEMGANFANFFGKPPDAWYMMGIAAGKMTTSNKLGFVAAFPLGWTSTFINAFELGAKSVNPKVQTIVAYTFSWGDRAKEADTTNSLINQGADVITMHVDSPATIIQTAEARGAMSIGFQSIESRKLAPKGWITGLGFTWGKFMTQVAQSVIDGAFKPGFVRQGIAEGMMGVAPFGPKVPADVQKLVNDAVASLAKGFNPFTGPIKDNKGVVRIAQGEAWGGDKMGNFDWFVEGVIGQAK